VKRAIVVWCTILAWAAIASLCACEDDSGPASVAVGGEVGRVTLATTDPILTLTRGATSLLAFPRDAFQLGIINHVDPMIAYDPYFVAQGMTNPSSLHFLQPKAVTLEGDGVDAATLHLSYDEGWSATVRVHADAAGRLSVIFAPDDAGEGRVGFLRVRPRASADEAFYGLGGVEDSVDQRGHLRPMQMEAELGTEAASTESNVPIPLLIGTRGWGVFAETNRLGSFDVARQDPTLIEITYATADTQGETLPLHLLSAEQPLDITKLYYDLTGKPHLPARWALGPLFWRDENKDQAQVLDDLLQLRTRDLPTSGMWIDRPYATAVNSFDFDATMFPDPKAMIQAIHDAGLRLALWHTPYLEPATGALRQQADAGGFFPPMPMMQFNNWSKPIDFTNPSAYAFWQGLIRRYTDLGVEGFKLDYAQDVLTTFPPDIRVPWQFFDGSDERTQHYDYQRLYHKVYAETLPADGGFLICRTGRWGDQKNVSVIWPGDMDATLTKHGEVFQDRGGKDITGVGGLPATVVVALSLGPSGFPFFGSDTGGYRHSPPDRETFIRWFEQTALSTVMQVGDSSSQAPWEYNADNGRDDAALDLYRIYARLHLRLFPYEWTYAQRLLDDGRPIMRALGLAYPALGVHPSDEYLFGEELLVAPVMERGATTRVLTLPPGEWVDWWDGSVQDGGVAGGAIVTVAAPIDKLPLFLRRGGIVPLLRPTIDTMSPVADPAAIDSFATTPGVLYARAVPPSEGAVRFTLYDGAAIEVTKLPMGHQVSITDGTEFEQGALVELFPVSSPVNVIIDGTPASASADLVTLAAAPKGWFWSSEHGGALYLKLPPGGGATTQ
jgi:alpha-D-xyloside xylohydrolase